MKRFGKVQFIVIPENNNAVPSLDHGSSNTALNGSCGEVLTKIMKHTFGLGGIVKVQCLNVYDDDEDECDCDNKWRR